MSGIFFKLAAVVEELSVARAGTRCHRNSRCALGLGLMQQAFDRDAGIGPADEVGAANRAAGSRSACANRIVAGVDDGPVVAKG